MPEPQALDHFTRPSPMTAGAHHADAVAALPADPTRLADTIHHLLVHQHWARRYAVAETAERRAQVQLRSVPDMLDALLAIDDSPLHEPRPPQLRLMAVCRHYSVLAVAALRANGIPARARCGFGMYFTPRKGVDHWIVEIWTGQRWQAADFQIDALQRQRLRLRFDPLDQPAGRFLSAGEAWQLCRNGRANPADFGFADEGGFFFIAMNIVRDLAALRGHEMLPWDDWGGMAKSDAEMSDDHMTRYDALAALTAAPEGQFAALSAAWSEPDLLVPATVFNAITRRNELVAL